MCLFLYLLQLYFLLGFKALPWLLNSMFTPEACCRKICFRAAAAYQLSSRRKVRLGLCRLERGEQCFVAMLAFPHFSPSDACRFPQFPKEHFLILRGCLRVSLGQSAEAQVFVQQTMKTASSDEELAFKQKEKDAQM